MNGLELKIERIRRGLKQYQVAAKAKLHPSVLCLIENQKREAKPRELTAIRRALGLKSEVCREREH